MAKKFLDSTGLKQVWAAVTDKVDTAVVDMNKTTEEITLEGTELADQLKAAGYTDGVIPAGTSVQDILTKLFCKEIYPNTSANTPGYTVSIPNNPSITANVNNGDLVEVGSTINFNVVNAVAVTVGKTDPIVSGLTHGYWVYDADSDTWSINEATTLTTSWSITQKAGEVYKLTPSITAGFTGGILPSEVSNSDAANVSLSACSLVVVKGANTYKVTESGPKYNGQHSGIAPVLEVSNLGNKNESEKTPEIAAANVDKTPEAKAPTFTVTGVYPVYNNSNGSTSLNKAEVSKMPLSLNKEITVSYGLESDGSTTCVNMFAYPATHECSVWVYNTISKEYETYVGGEETVNTTYNIQGKEVAYKLWKRIGGIEKPYPEATTFKFVLNKGLGE